MKVKLKNPGIKSFLWSIVCLYAFFSRVNCWILKFYRHLLIWKCFGCISHLVIAMPKRRVQPRASIINPAIDNNFPTKLDGVCNYILYYIPLYVPYWINMISINKIEFCMENAAFTTSRKCLFIRANELHTTCVQLWYCVPCRIQLVCIIDNICTTPRNEKMRSTANVSLVVSWLNNVWRILI